MSPRGLVWGNRGRLLAADGRPARHSSGRNWVCCVLEFHGRHRTQWQPNRLTELYFLDEPTALAAGHRPCGECRYRDHQSFKQAWACAHPGEPDDARSIDRRLHADRLLSRSTHRTHRAESSDLPDGVIIDVGSSPWLVRGAVVYAWAFDGYRARRPRSELPPRVTVYTPRSTVATLAAGYVPRYYHPTSDG